MQNKKYQKMINDIIDQTNNRGIHVIISNELSDNAVPVSSAEINSVIMSKGILESNKQGAYMLCHEVSHLAAGDRNEDYEDNKQCKEYCENTANIGALFILLNSYTKIYKKYDCKKAMEELYIPLNFKYYVIDILEAYKNKEHLTSLGKIKDMYILYRKKAISFFQYKQSSDWILKLI